MAKRQPKASAQSARIKKPNLATVAELAIMRDRIRRRFDAAADAVKAEWNSLVLNSAKEQSDRFDRVRLNLVAMLGYLRDFHIETFSSADGQTQRAFHSAAAVSCLLAQTQPSILDAVRFLTAASPVLVFGRVAKSHTDGIFWWVGTHDALFRAVDGFPAINGWNDEDYAVVRREIGGRDYFRSFIDATLKSGLPRATGKAAKKEPNNWHDCDSNPPVGWHGPLSGLIGELAQAFLVHGYPGTKQLNAKLGRKNAKVWGRIITANKVAELWFADANEFNECERRLEAIRTEPEPSKSAQKHRKAPKSAT